ncbi:MAG TPA: acetylxylan esterase [Candidatus Eisenbacteria bacterium]|nr:acetylxylan esterase [Candidatus Eisenbacteria bacterium]
MKAITTHLVCAAACLLPFNLLAQETAAERHAMATNQLKRITAEMSARCLNDIRSLDDWNKQRSELRRQLLEMLGLDPLPKRTPLKTQITGRLERNTYRIEKIVFQSSPGLYVTGNFYVPKGVTKPVPTILYLCGHSPHPLGAKFHYQDRAIWFASHGYPCLVLDTLEFAEISGVHHGTHDLNMWNWFSLGYTPAGVEVWNAICAVDYFETRPEVDKSHIGLTGISGGGAMTWYTAAVDERIAAAAPVCSTFTWGSQAEHWVARGQCDCIYYNNTYAWDFPVVGALIAPRPLLMLSGQKDTIFPPDGYHAVFQRAKKVYDLYADGNSERIREVDDNVEHSDPPLFLREARQWMQHWLKSDPAPLPIETNKPPKETAEALACLTQLPADAINYKIQNQFTALANLKKPSSRAAWERRREEIKAQLKEKTFRWFPTEKIPFDTKAMKGGGSWAVRYGYADYKDVSFQSEPGVRIRAQIYAPKNRPVEAPLLIWVKRVEDSFYGSDVDEVLPLLGRYTVLILNPRLTEQSMTAAEYTEVERTATWSSRTIAAMQVWDILRAVEWAADEEKISGSSISLYGKGDMGIAALYAALFDGRIKQIILNDPPASHWQRPALLNVLRVTDIPEVAGALAPRLLASLTKLPEAFDYTKRVYGLERAAKQLVEADSLPEALEVWKHPSANLAP